MPAASVETNSRRFIARSTQSLPERETQRVPSVDDGDSVTPTYTATLTLTPDSNASEHSRNITVTPLHESTVTQITNTPTTHSTQNVDGEPPNTVYKITNTDATGRSTINITVPTATETDPQTDTQGNTTTETISLPDGYVLYVLREYTTPSETTSEDLATLITDTYPQQSAKTAFSKFNESSEELLPPETQVPLTNNLINACPPLKNYQMDGDAYIAKHAFNLQSRVYPDKPSEWYTDLVQIYNNQDNLPDITVDEVHRAAIFRARLTTDDTGIPFETGLERIKTRLPGDKWHEALSRPNIGVLTALLYETENRSRARVIAGSTPTPVSKDEYSTLRRNAYRHPDPEQSELWCKLLPIAPSISNKEFISTLGNVAYWIAGDVNIQSYKREEASHLYTVAASLLDRHGTTRMQATAESRAAYTTGLHHKYHHRETEAEEQFLKTLAVWKTRSADNIDKYSYCGAIERLCENWADRLSETPYDETSEDCNVETGLDQMTTAQEHLPNAVSFPIKNHTRYENAVAFLNAVTAELTARKLIDMWDPETPVPTVEQITDQLTTAEQNYTAANHRIHAARIEETTAEFTHHTTTTNTDTDPNPYSTTG